MEKYQADTLKPGDQVFWSDPDEGLCSRWYKIKKILVVDQDLVVIEEPDGSRLECPASELGFVEVD